MRKTREADVYRFVARFKVGGRERLPLVLGESPGFEFPVVCQKSADRLGPDREATALAIGQEQASITELLAEHPVLRLQVFDDVLLGAIDPSRDDQDQKLKLESAHPRERTPGSESDAGPKAATAPAFRTLESFTFRIGRLLAHYEVFDHLLTSTQDDARGDKLG